MERVCARNRARLGNAAAAGKGAPSRGMGQGGGPGQRRSIKCRRTSARKDLVRGGREPSSGVTDEGLKARNAGGMDKGGWKTGVEVPGDYRVYAIGSCDALKEGGDPRRGDVRLLEVRGCVPHIAACGEDGALQREGSATTDV